MEKTKTKVNPKREYLKKISKLAREMLKTGEYDTINEALLSMYKEDDNEIKEFNTFHQWRRKGYRIEKGAKAFLVWGRPVKRRQDDEDDEFTFWPMCFLFSDKQVRKA